MEGPLPFPSPLTPPIVPFGNGRFNPTPDPTWSAAFSPFCFRVNPLMLLSSKPWLLLDLDARRTRHMEHTFESANRIVRSFPVSRYYDLC